MSGFGTKQTGCDVRDSVADGGKPDIVRNANFGSV